MKKYKVTYVTPTWSEVQSQIIPATDEQDARKPFDGIRIISVVEITDDAQLLIDNQTPAEVDAWNDGAATPADDLAVMAGIIRCDNIQDFYQGIIDDLSDELRDDTLTPAEAAEVTENIKFWQSRLDKNRNDFDIDEKEIRATHESVRPTGV